VSDLPGPPSAAVAVDARATGRAERGTVKGAPAIARAAARLPRGELVVFGPESHHEVLREVDPVRDRALAAIDEFLSRVLPR